MNYDREDARLRLLLLLHAAPANTSDQERLRRQLADGGAVLTRDAVRTELAWLDGVGAVFNRDSGGVFIPSLTEDGAEHVQGARIIPGVRRPTPSEVVRG